MDGIRSPWYPVPVMKTLAHLTAELKAAKALEAARNLTYKAAVGVREMAIAAFLSVNPEKKYTGPSGACPEWREFHATHAAPHWAARKQSGVDSVNNDEIRATWSARESARLARLAIQGQIDIAKGLANRAAGKAPGATVLAVVEYAPGEFSIVRDKIAPGRYVSAVVTSTGALVRAIGPNGQPEPGALPVIELPR